MGEDMWNGMAKFLRSNAFGLVAVFIALGGTAAAVNSGGSGGGSRGGSQAAKAEHQVAVVAKKGKRGPRGPAGPQGPPGQNGAPGQPGPGAIRLDFDEPETDDTFRTLGTIDGLTLEALCNQNGGHSNIGLRLTSTVAAVWNGSFVEDNGSMILPSNFSHSLAANTPLTVFSEESPGSGFARIELQATYRSATATISVPLHVLAEDSAAHCQVFGLAIPAT
jgi:hypothetical protein